MSADTAKNVAQLKQQRSRGKQTQRNDERDHSTSTVLFVRTDNCERRIFLPKCDVGIIMAFSIEAPPPIFSLTGSEIASKVKWRLANRTTTD